MRPRRYLERNRNCVRTGFAPGRPPPVHPRLTGACAAMRGFQICVSGHAQMQRPPSAWATPRSRFTMSNSPLRGSAAQHISFPRRIFAPGLSRRVSLSPPHLRCMCRRFGGLAPNPWRQLQLPPRNEGCRRSAGRRTALVCRASRATTHACEARGVPRKPGRPPLGAPPWRFRPRGRLPTPALSPDPAAKAARGQSLPWRARVPGFSSAALRAATADATPRSACWTVSGDAPP